MTRILLILGVALAFAAGAHYGWILVERGAYEHRVERLREAGEPTRGEDLERPPVPEEDNAAVALRKAQEWLDRHNSDSRRGRGLYDSYRFEETEDWTDDEWAELRTYVEGLAPYFELIEEAARRPAWHVEYDWSEGPFRARVDGVRWLQEASLCLFARVDLAQGDVTELAARTAVLHLDLADRCELSFLIGYLIRTTIRCQVAGILRRFHSRDGFDAPRFRALVDARLAAAIPTRGPPAEVLRAERMLMLHVVDCWGRGESIAFAEGQPSFLARPRVYWHAQKALDHYARAIEACGASPREAASLSRRFLDAPQPPFPQLASSQWCGKLFWQYAREVALLRQTRVVMALLEHKQKTGAWPDRLPEGSPVDPFTGEPFAYERTGNGARLRGTRAADDRSPPDEDPLLWSWD